MLRRHLIPFFIIGNPRSGTTLLRLMLNRHEEIVVPPESGFSIWLSDQFSHSDFSSPTVKSEFLSKIVESRKFETWGINEVELGNFLDKQYCGSYSDAVLNIYLFYAIKNGKTPWLIGDKNNFYIKYIDKIDSIFNNPKFVFIVRDGRDVACSYRALKSLDAQSMYSPKLPDKIETIAEEWSENNRKIIFHLKNSPDRSLLIKYEYLISQPEAELKKVCDFLAVRYDHQMLMYYQSNSEPAEFLAWKKKVVEPVDPDNFGMYKKILTNDEIDLFENIAKTELKYFGYFYEK